MSKEVFLNSILTHDDNYDAACYNNSKENTTNPRPYRYRSAFLIIFHNRFNIINFLLNFSVFLSIRKSLQVHISISSSQINKSLFEGVNDGKTTNLLF